jgi:uncharacterized membrane protein YfcA
VILVPLLMHFGLHPSVASASSSAMILMTSFSSTTSYIIYNVLLTDYAILGFGLGFCSVSISSVACSDVACDARLTHTLSYTYRQSLARVS